MILNDYLKLKSEVSVFVNLLLDEDVSLVENVRLFFWEVNNKNPEFINNTFPEMLHKLSYEENQGGISEIQFEKIAQEILGFIDKDKSLEELAETLIICLRNSNSEKEIRNTLVSLNLLLWSEKVMNGII